MDVALHVVLSAKQTSQQVSDFRNSVVLEGHFLNSFLLLKLNAVPICLKLCIESFTEALKEVLYLYIRNKMLKESHVLTVNNFCYREMVTFYTHLHCKKNVRGILIIRRKVRTDVSSSVVFINTSVGCIAHFLSWTVWVYTFAMEICFLGTLLYIC